MFISSQALNSIIFIFLTLNFYDKRGCVKMLCRHWNHPDDCPYCEDYREIMEKIAELEKRLKELEKVYKGRAEYK